MKKHQTRGHVIITGEGVGIPNVFVPGMLEEILDEEHGKNKSGRFKYSMLPYVVFLCEREITPEYKAFVLSACPKRCTRRIIFLAGSCSDPDVLKRVSMDSARQIYVLPNPNCGDFGDIKEMDSDNTYKACRILEYCNRMKNFRPNMLLIHMLPTSKSTAWSIGLNRSQVVSVAEMKSKFIIMGCQCPGSIPMISNMFSSWDKDDNPDMIKNINGGEERVEILTQYLNGCAFTTYPIVVWDKEFCNRSFKQAQRQVFLKSDGDMLMLGVHKSGKVVLNPADPTHQVQKGDLVVVLTNDREHLKMFGLPEPGDLEEWDKHHKRLSGGLVGQSFTLKKMRQSQSAASQLKDGANQAAGTALKAADKFAKLAKIKEDDRENLEDKYMQGGVTAYRHRQNFSFSGKSPELKERLRVTNYDNILWSVLDAELRLVGMDVGPVEEYRHRDPKSSVCTFMKDVQQKEERKSFVTHNKKDNAFVVVVVGSNAFPELCVLLRGILSHPFLGHMGVTVLVEVEPPVTLVEMFRAMNVQFYCGILERDLNLIQCGIHEADYIIMLNGQEYNDTSYLEQV